ncbi:hypothetical protein [Phytohabitans rumicis]|uniref:hypothetical protein n=1 Tax=Phytohabitans rumicis TaxID=1076125 RepID=UPI001564E7AD|nr:hypothetical protein [Phytohabitans rumicis]
MRDVRLKNGAPPVDLELRAGELVGVAGLEGMGKRASSRRYAASGRPAAAR